MVKKSNKHKIIPKYGYKIEKKFVKNMEWTGKNHAKRRVKNYSKRQIKKIH